MLRIRFQRVGKKNRPFFRIVVIERSRAPQGGRFEKVGFFNPFTKEKGLKMERIKYWLSVGAQPTDRVYNLLVEEKVVEGKKKSVHSHKKKNEKEKASEEKVTETKIEDKSVEEKKEKATETKTEVKKEDPAEKKKDDFKDSPAKKLSTDKK